MKSAHPQGGVVRQRFDPYFEATPVRPLPDHDLLLPGGHAPEGLDQVAPVACGLVDRPADDLARKSQRRASGGRRGWWARVDSDHRPRDYESPALTTELRARKQLIIRCTRFYARNLRPTLDPVAGGVLRSQN